MLDSKTLKSRPVGGKGYQDRKRRRPRMNIHQLTETEASYLLFAIKKTLRDRPGLTH